MSEVATVPRFPRYVWAAIYVQCRLNQGVTEQGAIAELSEWNLSAIELAKAKNLYSELEKKMKIDEIQEKMIAGSRNSILRAASKMILENMPQTSETEETGVTESMAEIARISGMEKSMVASMIIHGFMTAFVGGAMKQIEAVHGSSSMGQKVGNC